MVELTNSVNVFVEVKPQSAADDQELAERTALLTCLLQPKGYRYLMILPEQVESYAYLNNAKHLLLYSKIPMPETVWEMVRRKFTSENYIELSSLISVLGHANARSWIYRLLLSGDILSNLSEPITDHTLLHWNRQETV